MLYSSVFGLVITNLIRNFLSLPITDDNDIANRPSSALGIGKAIAPLPRYPVWTCYLSHFPHHFYCTPDSCSDPSAHTQETSAGECLILEPYIACMPLKWNFCSFFHTEASMASSALPMLILPQLSLSVCEHIGLLIGDRHQYIFEAP